MALPSTILVLSPTTDVADTAQEEEHQPWSITGVISPGQVDMESNWWGRVEGE